MLAVTKMRSSVVLGILVLSSLSVLVSIPAGASAYTPHAPILINGNGDFTVANGITGGSGTPSDPYVIEGWEIDASTANGIEVRDTDAVFVIRNGRVHSGGLLNVGVLLVNVADGALENVSSDGNWYGIYVASSTRIFITGSAIASSRGYGVFISYSADITLAGNTLSSNNGYGYGLTWSANVSISDTSAFSNPGAGIRLDSSNQVSISSSNISSNDVDGIAIYSSTNVTLTANTVSANGRYGVLLDHSSNVSLGANVISRNEDVGILFASSTGIDLSGNILLSDGVLLSGTTGPHFASHTIVSDNSVNGRPLLYYKDCTDLVLNDIPVGQVLLANCTRANIANLEISDTDQAIQVAYGNDIALMANRISDTLYGIGVWSSTRLSLMGNTLQSTLCGIALAFSSNATLSANVVSDARYYGLAIHQSSNVSLIGNAMNSTSWHGITLTSSKNVSVAANNISFSSGNGIRSEASTNVSMYNNSLYNNINEAILLWGSRDISVHHNNILNDIYHHPTQAADDMGSQNRWDNGYPSGGNHWSNFLGADNCSGPNQDICPAPDGIGDTPFVLDLDSEDRYPLMTSIPLADDFPPEVLIESPAEGVVVYEASIVVSGSAYDRGADGLFRVVGRINGGVWQNASGTESWTMSVQLSLGANRIEMMAWDWSGNPSSVASVNVTKANSPPLAAIALMPPPLDSPPFSVWVDASQSSDLEDTLDSLSVRWDWEDDGVWDTTWSTTKAAHHQYSAPGTYTIRLEVRDTGGLVSNATRQVEVNDDTPPLITHTPHGDVPVNKAIIITVNVTDDIGVKVVCLHYKAVGATTFIEVRMIRITGDTYEATIPAQSESGTVYYYINATDDAGNEARHPQTGEHSFSVNAGGELMGLDIYVVLAIVIVVAVLAAVVILVLMRRKKKEDAVPAAEEPKAEEEETEEPSESPPKSPS
jgi:parallel beta-helix repeat protein